MGTVSMNQLAAILWHYAATKRNARRWRERADLEAWQDRAVQQHLARILPRSPFYRKRYAGLAPADWRNFSITNKAELMADSENWNTAGIRREDALNVALKAESSRDFAPTIGNITIGLSSGTSGNRGLFLVSPAERHAWAGSLLERHRAARHVANARGRKAGRTIAHPASAHFFSCGSSRTAGTRAH